METKYIPAIFEAGKLCPLVPLDLEEHERVEVAVVRAPLPKNEATAASAASAAKQRVQLPLVPSSHPGSLELTGQRVAELLDDDDLSG